MEDVAVRLVAVLVKGIAPNAAAVREFKRKPESLRDALAEKALAKFYEAVKEEQKRLRLGMFGRARLAYGVQKQMIAVGYPPELTKRVVFAMITSSFIRSRSQ